MLAPRILNRSLFDAKPQIVEKHKNDPILIFIVYFLSERENPFSYRRSRTQENSQLSGADTLWYVPQVAASVLFAESTRSGVWSSLSFFHVNREIISDTRSA